MRRGGRGFFRRWLARSLRGSAGASAVSTASLALSAALVFSLVAVSSGIEEQLGAELRAYGANVLVVPRAAALRFGLGTLELGPVEEDRTLASADLGRLGGDLVDVAAPGLVLTLRVAGREVGATGWDLQALRRLNPLWRVAPRWPEAPGEAMLGASLATRLGVKPGDAVEVASGERIARVAIVGTVETGGAEDENLLLSLPLAQEISGRAGQASLALVRARLEGRAPEAVARAIEAAVPGAEARTLRQVARSEASLLGKVKRLILLVTIALSAATAFTVAGTLGVLLLARREEIGLYLALGAPPSVVRRLLLSEAAAAGLAGGIAGCLAGAAGAQVVARTVFGTWVPLSAAPPILALAAALGIALGASTWPVQRALQASPCDTLRAP